MKDVGAVTFAIQSFVTLFVIMDPPGAAPIFLGLVSDKTQRVRRILAMQAAAVSFLVISIFALFGRAILEYLNISLEALQAAGALLLLLVALELLTGNAKSMNDDSNACARGWRWRICSTLHLVRPSAGRRWRSAMSTRPARPWLPSRYDRPMAVCDGLCQQPCHAEHLQFAADGCVGGPSRP